MPVLRPAEFNNLNNSGTGSSPTARDPDMGSVYGDYWHNDAGAVGDFLSGTDTFGHNEALAAYERSEASAEKAFNRTADYNAREAEKQRQYEEYMSNSAFRRKVADYVAAGFSPLAALEGSVGASTPSGSAASATSQKGEASSANKNNGGIAGLLGAVITAFAMIASKGLSTASAAANQSARNATSIANTLAKNGTAEKVAALRIASNEKIYSSSFAKKIAEDQEQKIRAEYLRKLEEKEIERLNKLHRNPYGR